MRGRISTHSTATPTTLHQLQQTTSTMEDSSSSSSSSPDSDGEISHDYEEDDSTYFPNARERRQYMRNQSGRFVSAVPSDEENSDEDNDHDDHDGDNDDDEGDNDEGDNDDEKQAGTRLTAPKMAVTPPPPPTRPPPAPVSPLTINASCIICFEHISNIVLFPCRHLVICQV